MRDITELKQAEEKMAGLYAQVQSALQETQQSQLLLRSIIDATPDWIFIKDQEHRYRLANQGYAKALHLSPDDFIGKNDLELGFPEELVKGNPDKGIRGFWTDDRQVLDSGEPLVNPSDPATIDGQVHIFHTIKTPLRDADGHIWGVLAFARDTTEREQLLTETGAQAQRMALLNELGAQLSQTSSVDEVFKVANLKTNQIMKADRASIALLNPAGDTFKVLALDGIKGAVPVGAQMPVEGTAVGLAIREKRMIVLGNLETSQFLDTRRLGEQGVRSTMNAPLVVGGQTIGTLNVASKWPDAYSSADENLLLQIASLLSSAIESRRLLEAAQQRAEQEHLVRTITEKVRRGASREAILQTTLQELSRTLGASKAFVRLGSQARLISQGDTTTSNQETLPDQIKGVSR
jgi:PAS domain S-box-containing protein